MEENTLTPKFKVIIIGGSAGSLEALMQIVPQLDKIPNVAMVIVLHRKSGEDSTLEDLFRIKCQVSVKEVEDKVRLEPGNIYIAPSNYHLLFESDGRMSLDISEKINYSRPSIDVAFESAAEAYGENLVGILLSGSNADGTAGLQAIQDHRGVVVVQDPNSAEMPYMPRSAIEHMTADYILDANGIFEFITGLAEL